MPRESCLDRPLRLVLDWGSRVPFAANPRAVVGPRPRRRVRLLRERRGRERRGGDGDPGLGLARARLDAGLRGDGDGSPRHRGDVDRGRARRWGDRRLRALHGAAGHRQLPRPGHERGRPEPIGDCLGDRDDHAGRERHREPGLGLACTPGNPDVHRHGDGIPRHLGDVVGSRGLGRAGGRRGALHGPAGRRNLPRAGHERGGRHEVGDRGRHRCGAPARHGDGEPGLGLARTPGNPDVHRHGDRGDRYLGDLVGGRAGGRPGGQHGALHGAAGGRHLSRAGHELGGCHEVGDRRRHRHGAPARHGDGEPGLRLAPARRGSGVHRHGDRGDRCLGDLVGGRAGGRPGGRHGAVHGPAGGRHLPRTGRERGRPGADGPRGGDRVLHPGGGGDGEPLRGDAAAAARAGFHRERLRRRRPDGDLVGGGGIRPEEPSPRSASTRRPRPRGRTTWWRRATPTRWPPPPRPSPSPTTSRRAPRRPPTSS